MEQGLAIETRNLRPGQGRSALVDAGVAQRAARAFHRSNRFPDWTTSTKKPARTWPVRAAWGADVLAAAGRLTAAGAAPGEGGRTCSRRPFRSATDQCRLRLLTVEAAFRGRSRASLPQSLIAGRSRRCTFCEATVSVVFRQRDACMVST